jgi:hypothetical protein
MLALLAMALQAEYYPLKEGNTWTFQGQVGKQYVTIVSRVKGREKIAGKECWAVEMSGVGNPTVEYLAVAEDGIRRMRVGKQDVDPPVPILRFPLRVGDKWSAKYTAGAEAEARFEVEGEDEVTLRLGTFKAYRQVVTMTSGKETVRTVLWYAKGVGPIRQVLEVGKETWTLELVRFENRKE